VVSTDADAILEGPGLSRTDVAGSLAELAEARERVYFDAEADAAAAAAYYDGVAAEQLGELVRRTHVRTPRYKPARELYPWVDLQPTGMLRSLYTGHEWDPEELIRADLAIAEARARRMADRLADPGPEDAAAVEAEVAAALPFNCEHVVPQSWFAEKEPMRGDLHHLFACESRCNSFRGNTPFTEFADFPERRTEGSSDVVRGECGKSEGKGFEPARGKGAAARAVFYFLLRYPGLVDEAEMPPDRHAILSTWHREDPVTEWERHRNAAIFERQGNRNPYVDRPALVENVPLDMASRRGR
jgi:endonuclease I